MAHTYKASKNNANISSSEVKLVVKSTAT